MSEHVTEIPLPSDVNAERVILATILIENDEFFEGAADLSASDFYLESHRKIYACINDIMFGMVEGTTAADIITVAAELQKRKELKAVGGSPYISDLGGDTLNRTRNISHYVDIIRQKARLRRLMGIFSVGNARAADQVDSPEEIVSDVQNRLVDEAAEGESGAVRIGDVSGAVEERVEKARHASEERIALGLTWGVEGLNKFTKGAHLGEVTVLAAESGGFKTSFAMQMVLENAREGTPCGVFSLEMSKEKLVQRTYPQMGDYLTADMMRDPRLMNEGHIAQMGFLSEELQRLPIWIDDSVSLHINTLVARIRMMRRKYGIKLFVIDYLQLIANDAKTEAESIKGIMFKLRDLVKLEPDVHILLLSQFSKADGFSKKRRRTRSDLMGSSAIHHAAQNVLIITVDDEEEGKEDPAYLLDAEFRFDKQRDGRKGKVVCGLDRIHLRFRHPEPQSTF